MWRNTGCLLKVIYSLVSKVQKAVCNILYFRKFLRDIMKAQKNFFHFKRFCAGLAVFTEVFSEQTVSTGINLSVTW